MIECKYSCAGCGLYRVTCSVPARTTEDVKVWLEQIAARAVSEDHAQRSPFCASRVMSEFMIPTTGADRIGGPAIN